MKVASLRRITHARTGVSSSNRPKCVAPHLGGEHFEGDNAPNPQAVADAVAKLIATPAGERPFRTVVDNLGMGDAIEPYNHQAEAVTATIYEAFGMADMLELKQLVAAGE